MNNLACKGLVATQAAFEKDYTNKDASMATVDPSKLIKSGDNNTWKEVPDEKKTGITDEASGTVACRAWFDANAYEKPYCCLIVVTNDAYPYVIDSTGTEAASAFTIMGIKHEFNAITFNGAQMILSGIAAIASTVVYMQ